MAEEQSIYERLGIDAQKSTVKEIFEVIINNDFPDAFVNIIHDPEYPGEVWTKHSDGDGSKSVQRILHYFETNDITIFQGAVDDAFSMNTGDIAASGFVNGLWMITQVININKFNLPKDDIMRQNALRVAELLEIYRGYGFDMMFFLGGETADLPDQTKSMIYDLDICARTKKGNIISGNIQPNDAIWGFHSDGQAAWEDTPNSGIMSNGLTLARTCLMSPENGENHPVCAKGQGEYEGYFFVNDPKMIDSLTVSEAILSPTRQWAIVIKLIIDKLTEKNALHMLHGISMNTGGGATKICNVGDEIIFHKCMLIPPPIFQLIQKEADETWENMFESFNCGIGIDVVGEDTDVFTDTIIEVSKETMIEVSGLGHCERNLGKGNKVVLQTPYGTFDNY